MQRVRHRTGFHRTDHVRHDLIAGSITGQIGGLVMALMVIAAVLGSVAGRGAVSPAQLVGSLVFGDVAVRGAFHLPSFVAGLLLHLGVASFWGVVFAGAVHAVDARRVESLMLTGIAVGLVAHIVDVGIVLPLAFTARQGYDVWAEHVAPRVSWLAHVVYGLSLTTFGWVRPQFRRPLY